MAFIPIKFESLRVGLFVKLECLKWDNPFAEKEFKITSPIDIPIIKEIPNVRLFFDQELSDPDPEVVRNLRGAMEQEPYREQLITTVDSNLTQFPVGQASEALDFLTAQGQHRKLEREEVQADETHLVTQLSPTTDIETPLGPLPTNPEALAQAFPVLQNQEKALEPEIRHDQPMFPSDHLSPQKPEKSLMSTIVEVVDSVQELRSNDHLKETSTIVAMEQPENGSPLAQQGARQHGQMDQKISEPTSKRQRRPGGQTFEAKNLPAFPPEKWFSILQKEYLCSYMRQGGTSVKVAVSVREDTHQALQQGLQGMAKAESFVFARIDSRYTKLHLVDRVFFKVAKQIEWEELAHEFVTRLFLEKGYQVPESGKDFTLQQLASLNDRQEILLWKDFQTWIEQAIAGDPHLCWEFRMAMLCLCSAQLQAGEADLQLAQSVKEWLHGELKLISSVKRGLIFQKITRHNGRHMLASLTHWVRRAGKPGIVITLDIARYLEPKRPTPQDTTLYYSPGAVLDMYDVLRQFIDGTDDHAGCLIVVLAPPTFLTDIRRGLDRYEALKLRIWDDVRDKSIPNPLAPMVRLDEPPDVWPLGSLMNDMAILQNDSATLGDRRVIEGLRAGVPNRDVIQVLGCYQPEVERRFQEVLTLVEHWAPEGRSSKGMIVEGGFGTGKSHVLEYLQHLALQRNFICSRVIISKETPLYNPMKVYLAAIESAVIPNRTGQVLMEIANKLDVWSSTFQELSDWVHDPKSGMDQRFAATLFLFQQMSSEPELRHRVIRFWSGEPLAVNEIRTYLRQCGAYKRYSFPRVRDADLAVQRFLFTSRLMRVAGYHGWVLCIDEAELIGRYSFKQRVKSYAELARWIGSSPEIGIPGLAAVMALTNDFQKEILENKGDRSRVLDAVGQGGSQAQMETRAEEGIRFIERETTPLCELTSERIEEAYHKIRQLHRLVYCDAENDLSTTDEVPPGHLAGKRMRECVKSWVTEWDLKRLLHRDDIDLEVRPLKQEYKEDEMLEAPSEEEQSGSSWAESSSDRLLSPHAKIVGCEP